MPLPYPGGYDYPGTVSAGGLIQSSYINSLNNSLQNIEQGLNLNPTRGLCEGRLTLQTTVPIPDSDQVGATTIYYTPYVGNRIALFNGLGTWTVYPLSSDLSLPLGTLTTATLYDVFCYANAGVPTLEIGPAWASSTSRAVNLGSQDGVLVKPTDATRRYLGTFYTSAATTTEDSAHNRLLFNFYNQVPRHLLAQNVSSVAETATAWTAVANTQIALVVGWLMGSFQYAAFCNGASNSGTVDNWFGAGVGSTPGNAAFSRFTASVANDVYPLTAPTAFAYPSLGYNTADAYAYTTAGSTLTLLSPACTALAVM